MFAVASGSTRPQRRCPLASPARPVADLAEGPPLDDEFGGPASRPVMTISVMSAMNISPSGLARLVSVRAPARRRRPVRRSSPRPTTRSPCPLRDGRSGRAARSGSRSRSAPLRVSVIEPKRSSPSSNSHSMPEMRGEPSARSVAMVLRPASKSRLTRSANSGSACSIAFHAGTARQRIRMWREHKRLSGDRRSGLWLSADGGRDGAAERGADIGYLRSDGVGGRG